MNIDPKKLRRLKEVRGSDILFSIAARGDDGRVLVGSSDAGVYELDMSSEKPERAPLTGEGHRSYVTGLVTFGDSAASCGYDGRLVWWDLENRRAIRAVAAHDKWIRRVLSMPDGKRLVTVADDMRCRVWNADDGEQLADFTDHAEMTPHHFPSMLYAVAVSPDGRFLATGDRVGHVAIWETENWSKVAELETPVMYTWDPRARRHSIGGIRSLAFSPDGNRLAVGGTGKINNIDHLEGRARVEIFEWETGERLHELEDEKRKGLVEQLIWIPDTPYLLTAGGDHNGFLTFYDAVKGEMVHQDGNGGHIHGVATTDFRTFYIAAHERLESWTLDEEQ